MTWSQVSSIAKSVSGGAVPQYYLRFYEVQALFGLSASVVRRFISEQGIPYYRISGSGGKSYFLPELLEAVGRVRWKSDDKQAEKVIKTLERLRANQVDDEDDTLHYSERKRNILPSQSICGSGD